MADVRIGTVDLPDRMERDRYFQELDYLELSALFAGPLNSAVLAKWAAVTPKDTVGLVAPFVLTHRQPPRGSKLWAHDLSVGDFRDSGLGRVALGQLGEAITKLGARCAVFRSPPLFAASQANRDTLKKFFTELATPEAVGGRVWVPDGLWDARTAVKFATEIGVTAAIDPLAREPGQPLESFFDLEASSLYFRITGLNQPLSAEKQDDLAALVEHYQAIPLTVAFDSPSRWQDARALRSLLREGALD
ncbi:MAG: DUF72 domain-containing protein [Deltaproteobacteria bacterium]|nr:DUF72 domain-containing protein [Deltaproteobacteria bacterium]